MLEADFPGNGSWKQHGSFSVGANGYLHHAFPPGYSARWARIRSEQECVATAYFTYT